MTANPKISALILAAGKGTRMKSTKAKVLHEVFFAPMLHHVLDAVQPLTPIQTIIVIGHQGEQVKAAVKDYPVVFAEQQQQLGTGHAVLAAEEHLRKVENGTVMILCGDTPLIRTETLGRMVAEHFAQNNPLSVMTTVLADPANYGRIITDESGNVLRIVEEKDASPAERKIREVNAGIYCVDTGLLLGALWKVDSGNKQGEFYLTDIVGIANREGHAVSRFLCPEPDEVLGVNSRLELAQAHAGLQQRRNRELMAAGVTILQPESTFVEKQVVIGCDTVLHPGVHLQGATVVGSGCSVGPYAMLQGAVVGDGARVGGFSWLVGTQVAVGESVPAGTRNIAACEAGGNSNGIAGG
ncbi:MAG TPA: NTP transferase domain-containing protein [Candidatus Sulfotelmatobacter sp.]|nr:NTP transferase domain-containing protein [Candidatus Sulfotelmatobacter sp.]